MMEFRQVIEQRRSVRHYQPTPVEPEKIEHVIRAATLAPSSMNMQPWTFAVITGQERLDVYADRAKKHVLSHVSVSQLSIPAAYMLDDPHFSIFYHAPVLVIVMAKADEPQAREDCCLAAHALMLAARDLELGTCWVGFGRAWLNLPETKSELGLSGDSHVVAPIVMGYPVAWPEGRARNSPSIHWVP